tara:strand:+ start:8479 stop:8682 length:204 start_codon:yes stop_codon:yes gene_type:complete
VQESFNSISLVLSNANGAESYENDCKKIGTDPENEIQINAEGITEVHARLSIKRRRAVYLSYTSPKA